jgi:hypothetical protein
MGLGVRAVGVGTGDVEIGGVGGDGLGVGGGEAGLGVVGDSVHDGFHIGLKVNRHREPTVLLLFT